VIGDMPTLIGEPMYDEQEVSEELQALVECAGGFFADATVRHPEETDVPGFVIDFPRSTFIVRVVRAW
jgi:hypothetical protein